MSKETIRINGEMHIVNQCGTCAVWHTIPKIIYDSYHAEGGFWHCPNGHQRGFRKGEDERKQEEVRLERDRLKQERAQLQDEIAAQKRKADEAKQRAHEAEKKFLNARRRHAAGVCPCCNRTFTNVQRHMKTKHPTIVPLEQKTA